MSEGSAICRGDRDSVSRSEGHFTITYFPDRSSVVTDAGAAMMTFRNSECLHVCLKIVMTRQTASFPRSQARGPRASSPPNSIIVPSFVHSHHIPIEPFDGPLPPPFRSGSPRTWTNSFPVVPCVTCNVPFFRTVVKGVRGYGENALSDVFFTAVDALYISMLSRTNLSSSSPARSAPTTGL